jgi:hypothetical protein
VKNGKDKCGVHSCIRDAEVGGLCATCYNGMYYWKGATPTRILKRAKQLAVLTDRMELISGNRRSKE